MDTGKDHTPDCSDSCPYNNAQETARRHRPLLVCMAVKRLIPTWKKMMALLTASMSVLKIC